MWCAWVWAIIMIIGGIWMIVTKKGFKVLSKSHEDVYGKDAVAQGTFALILGLGVVTIILWMTMNQ